ncbi:hypothetical protein RHECNPAF_1760041 [Rhizobium etli CNPAF512]|nr:hypothetical protein RHECNPAF_1760041 [Rhizobium etli CNPAF512]
MRNPAGAIVPAGFPIAKTQCVMASFVRLKRAAR